MKLFNNRMFLKQFVIELLRLHFFNWTITSYTFIAKTGQQSFAKAYPSMTFFNWTYYPFIAGVRWFERKMILRKDCLT